MAVAKTGKGLLLASLPNNYAAGTTRPQDSDVDQIAPYYENFP